MLHSKRNVPELIVAVVGLLMLATVGCADKVQLQTAPDTAGTSSAGGAGALAGASHAGGVSQGGEAAAGKAASPTGVAAGAAGIAATGIGPGAAGAAGATDTALSVVLSELAFTLATPDLTHSLSATVTGSSTTAVTWSSSDTYIATVNAAGTVTAVSGGQATITATSVADATKAATATVTVAEPSRTKANRYVDPTSITAGPVNILMCGDSLMRTYAPNASDQTGWGQVLNQFLSNEVTVDNSLANGGRSSRSFYNEVGRWVTVKARLAASIASGTPTFVFIMFGHNDQKKLSDTNGADYLTFASQNENGTVAGTFYDYLERYIVETRDLGGIPVLVTPFVRQYLEGAPAIVTIAGQHNITVPYTGETAARGDYPAAVKAIATKHDVPVIDITTWSKEMVEARARAGTLGYVYIDSDQTHVRELGALLMAEEAVRELNALGILTNQTRAPAARVMLDSGLLAFGGLYVGNTLDKSLRISPFGDVQGRIDVTAPAGYTISSDATTFTNTLSIACDASYPGSQLYVRFAPTDPIAYNANLTVSHSSLVADYGNTVPNATLGAIALTGNGKVALSGALATVTWPLFVGATIVLEPTATGAAIGAAATLTGLVNKSVLNAAARFDTPDGIWPAESARNAARFIQFTVPVTAGTFTLDTLSVDGGSAGGSNMRWDIAYSLAADFSSPTALGTALNGSKDTLVSSSFPSLGVNVAAGQTLYLRIYPYNTSAATGKSVMLANVVASGVTN